MTGRERAKKQALERRQKLQAIVRTLDRLRLRATYGAVADVIRTNPRSIGRMLADRCPEHSWIVNKSSGQPTGYVPSQKHRHLEQSPQVITTDRELLKLL